MDVGPVLWLLMTVGGAGLLGLALAYGLVSTRRRRENPVAQRLTEIGTRDVYRDEEERRAHIEEGSAPVVGHSQSKDVTVTEARQAVTGHYVHVVLITSLFLAVLAAVSIYAYLWP
jgi:hypothetical protein